MKYIKYLLIVMIFTLILPVCVFAADDNKSKTTDNKVNVYLFRGDGCPHCQEAEEFFDSIKDEYNDKFNLVDYEVWYNEDNSKLMQKVADYLGQDISGVPYILVGKKTWSGYSSEESEEIKTAINDEYKKDSANRYDVMEHLNSDKEDDSTGSDILSLIIIVIVAAGIVGSIIYMRKKA